MYRPGRLQTDKAHKNGSISHRKHQFHRVHLIQRNQTKRFHRIALVMIPKAWNELRSKTHLLASYIRSHEKELGSYTRGWNGLSLTLVDDLLLYKSDDVVAFMKKRPPDISTSNDTAPSVSDGLASLDD